ncbi:MAG: PulJ/GspJ family protein [Gammaproteobacteria bacterium]
MNRAQAQRGFTLIELLVAMTLSAFLFGVLYQFLAQTAIYSEIMIQRVRANQEAREAFDLVANGGVFDNDGNGLINTTDPYTVATDEAVISLRGNATIEAAVLQPNGGTIARVNQRLELTHNGMILRTKQLNQTVECTAAGAPHDDCVAAGELIIEGYHSQDPAFSDQVNSRSYNVSRHCGNAIPERGVTQEVDVTFIDPRMVARADFDYTAEQTTATYQFLVAHRVDCLP